MTPQKEWLDLLSLTWDTPYLTVSCKDADCHFLVSRRKLPYSIYEVDHAAALEDKAFFHWWGRTFEAAALDALARCLNEFPMSSMIPYRIRTKITLPEYDPHVITEVVRTL